MQDSAHHSSDTKANNQAKKKIFFLLLFIIPTALVYTAVVQEFRHTLANRQDWVSTKPELKRALMGAICYTVTPISLARHRLNVGAWNGFQEILLKTPVKPAEFRFDMEIPEWAYVNIIYNRTQEGFSGFRLSRSPGTENIHFTASPDGRFLSKYELPLEVPEGQHKVRLTFSSDETTMYIDDTLAAKVQEPLNETQILGFRGGAWDVYIDNVEIRARDGRVIKDSFSVPPGSIMVFLIIFIFMALFMSFVVLLARRRSLKKGLKDQSIMIALALNLVVLVIGPALYSVHRWYLSGEYSYAIRYFHAWQLFNDEKNPIEQEDEIVARLRKEYNHKAPGEKYRIMFIGTSQTWGSGATTLASTFVQQTEDLLNRDAGGQKFECINTGISGSTSPVLFNLYKQEWINWKPKTTIVILSNNDMDKEAFREHLGKFIEINKAHKIKTIFVLEANDINSPGENTLKMHEIMKEVAKKSGVPIIDLHGFMGKNRNTGLMWWDFVHFTDYGHQLAAGLIHHHIKEHMDSARP